MKHRIRTSARSVFAAVAASSAVIGCASTDTDVPSSPPATEGRSTSRALSDVTEYRDGRYTAAGWYGGLPSRIDVTLALDDGVITAVEITRYATDPASRDYQDRFAAAISGVVVGRSIDEVAVDRVAGASGTSEGFNAALEDIKAQASR